MAISIMERMTTGKFRHIPVVERDRLVGIVSIGDIVKHRLWELEQESAALRDYIQTAYVAYGRFDRFSKRSCCRARRAEAMG